MGQDSYARISNRKLDWCAERAEKTASWACRPSQGMQRAASQTLPRAGSQDMRRGAGQDMQRAASQDLQRGASQNMQRAASLEVHRAPPPVRTAFTNPPAGVVNLADLRGRSGQQAFASLGSHSPALGTPALPPAEVVLAGSPGICSFRSSASGQALVSCKVPLVLAGLLDTSRFDHSLSCNQYVDRSWVAA